ncbi:hypothetical protein KCP91_15530 [Microvirga sp. SRT01]|uniref:Novel STAND NTPase 5 domain-containing protein n=1 Tax=Sphingomonas longa TaxID=2778730 RepID=A0ABS2DA23_9SPHN|nr:MULTISPECIES: hypothetical protein [Alphaproteobacteria]MBM6577794.1 hypothetical protein [Sphingomonas sp. BT552]MBR7710836.1 hypothetical protein [Microvirga sp. SRT01]
MAVLSGDAAGALESFLTLRRFWSEKRHAIGGLAAMAGFDFQLASALHVIVRQEAGGQGGAAFIEVLSDIVESSDGFLITQAKRTLSSSAFRSALDELWGVHLLAKERTPDLLPLLRYRVQAATRTLGDWTGSLARWSPEGADGDALAVFRERVDIAVTPSPRLEAAKILIEEFRDADPLERLDRAMSRFLAASGGVLDQVVDEFRAELRALRLAAATVERRFGLWSSEERAPDQVVCENDDRRAVRIGERLSVSDLREGRLAKRAVYDRIERACEERLAGERPLYKLPVFWISGRSGCGKSAALLHVAARLHAQNPDRLVLWVGHRPELLGPAVRWAGRMAAEGRAVVLVLDDPFTAERQSEFIKSVTDAQAEWESICVGAGETARSPLLLCCGPNEQRASAEEACGGQLDFDGFDMPNETDADFLELAEWYRLRTGRSVEPMEGNVLLVQQLFEWTKGSIAEFARRFRDRIRSFDDSRQDGPVLDAIASILALNRLYVDYPMSELLRSQHEHPTLESALIRLQELESHFQFTAQSSSGIRLTHPHLADAIYREWFGRITDRPWRKRHLAASLAADLVNDERPPEVRYAPFWAISRLARERDRGGRETDPALRARIDLIRPELREVLSSIYANGVADGLHPIEDLPVWLALDRLLDLRLNPSPADLLVTAIDEVQEPVRGLRLSCHFLLAEEGPFRDRAVASVSGCLRRLAGWGDPLPWHDWAPLAMDYVSREGGEALLDEIAALSRDAPQLRGMSRLMNGLAQGETSKRVRGIVVDWLQRTPDDEFGWGSILSNLIDGHGHCAETDVLSQRLLAAGRDRGSWPRVWAALIDTGRGQPAALRRQGMRWLGLTEGSSLLAGPETPGWDMIWRRLLDQAIHGGDLEVGLLLGVGRDWVEASDVGDERWTRVWPDVFEHADPRERGELLALAVRRLRSAPVELKGWSHVWGPAIQEARRSADRDAVADLEGIGREWLATADPEHLGWAFVFEGLLLATESAERLTALRFGAEWLESSSGGHRSWAHVWLALAKAAPDETRNAIEAQGLTWLRRTPGEHVGWSRVAGYLLEDGSSGAISTARALSTTWLLRHDDHPGWLPVIPSWIASDPGPGELEAFQAHCSKRLSGLDLDDDAWFRVWQGARRARLPTKILTRLALDFLTSGRGVERRRAALCSYALGLRAETAVAAALVDQGMSLIRSDALGRSWPSLWEGLAKHESPSGWAELLDAASAWLLTSGPSHDRWDRVLLRARAIDKRFARRPGIAAGMTIWLRANGGAERWMKVWSIHPEGEALLDDRTLRDPAVAAVLKPHDNGAWVHLCAALLLRLDGAARDQALGCARSWLEGPAERYGFGLLWRSAFDVETDDAHIARLIELGLEALPLIEPKRWYLVFSALLRVAPKRFGTHDVIASVDAWLGSEAGGGKGWLRVMKWRELVDPSPWTEAAIVARAHRWLSQTDFSDRNWSLIWRSAIRAKGGRDTIGLRRLGERWLDEAAFTMPGWPYVWRSIWDMRSRDGTASLDMWALGIRWLKSGVKHKDRRLVDAKLK